MYLICHLTLHDNLIELLRIYKGGSSAKYLTILVSLLNIGIMIVEIQCF